MQLCVSNSGFCEGITRSSVGSPCSTNCIWYIWLSVCESGLTLLILPWLSFESLILLSLVNLMDEWANGLRKSGFMSSSWCTPQNSIGMLPRTKSDQPRWLNVRNRNTCSAIMTQWNRMSTTTIVMAIIEVELPQHWKCLLRKRKVRENCCMLTKLHIYLNRLWTYCLRV